MEKNGTYGVATNYKLDPSLPSNLALAIGTPSLRIRCEGGWIVASIAGEAGEYDEIAVDFVEDGGSIIQLAVIGRTEGGTDDPSPMHVYAYDGQNADVAQTTYVTVDENSIRY